MTDKVYVVECRYNDCVVGVFTTPERAMEASRKDAARIGLRAPEFAQSLNGAELRVWNEYNYGQPGANEDYYIEEFLIDDGE